MDDYLAKSLDEVPSDVPDVSPALSVFWKPLRRLFADGSPLTPVTILHYAMPDNRQLPFAAMTKTRASRLVLWPAIDAHSCGHYADGGMFSIDHVTLELSNGKTHLTSFDSDSHRSHDNRGWGLGPLCEGLCMWLIVAFRVQLLQKQIGALEQSIPMPTSDVQRRVAEYQQYASQMRHIVVNPPPLRGDCIVTAIHLARPSASGSGFRPEHFPQGPFWDEWIEDWPDGDLCQIVPTAFSVNGTYLIMLTTSPPGRLKGECFVGAPIR